MFPQTANLPAERPSIRDSIIQAARRARDMQRSSRGESFAEFAARRLFIRTKAPDNPLLDVVLPFRLNGIQTRLMAEKQRAVEMKRPRKYLILKYRQGGITTLEQGLSYWRSVTSPNSRCLTLSYSKENTRELFDIATLMDRQDPEAIRREHNNRQELRYQTINSVFNIGTAGNFRAGRGLTLSRVHGSEVALWGKGGNRVDVQREVMAGLAAAVQYGEMDLETTAVGNEWFCQTYKEAKALGLRSLYVPFFFPWFIDRERNRRDLEFGEFYQIMDTLTDRERQLMREEKITPEMVKFRREQQGIHKTLFPQEFPEDDESCFLMAGTCYFDVDDLRRRMERLEPYESTSLPGGGTLTQWEAPRPGRSYSAGADTSEGLPGGDFSCLKILDDTTGNEVACLHGLWRPHVFAGLVCELAGKYNRARLAVERNNTGHAVIAKCIDLQYRNIYKGEDGRDGWDTNSKTRPAMLAELHGAIHNGYMTVKDREMLGECLSFRMNAAGDFGADSGAHDDRVFATGIAWMIRKARPVIAPGSRIITAGAAGFGRGF